MKSRMCEMTAHWSRRARPTQFSAPVFIPSSGRVITPIRKKNRQFKANWHLWTISNLNDYSERNVAYPPPSLRLPGVMGSDVNVHRFLPEVDRRRGKVMLRPWSGVFMLFCASCCEQLDEKRRNCRSSSQGILHGIGSIKAAHMALTGDHYRTLEAIKQLEPAINDSSQGPADLAQ